MCEDSPCAYHVCNSCSASVKKRDRAQGATPLRGGKRGRQGGEAHGDDEDAGDRKLVERVDQQSIEERLLTKMESLMRDV
eukprot:8078076-Karenia_brevis.AAC.1